MCRKVADPRVDHLRGMRWYNPTLEAFEWRDVPQSDEEALSVLDGSTYTPHMHADIPGVAWDGCGHYGGAYSSGRGGQGEERRMNLQWRDRSLSCAVGWATSREVRWR